jgi:tight adherence protein C
MIFVAIIGAFAVCSSFIVLWWAVSGERGGATISRLGEDGVTDMRAIVLRRSSTERTMKPLVERVGIALRKITPTSRVAALSKRIQAAGSPPGWTVERMIAARVTLAVSLGLLLTLRAATDPNLLNVLFVLLAAGIGYFLPVGLLDRRAEARNLLIRGAVSDTVDQLSVMVRAGLGIDAAIARAASSGEGPLADELSRVMQDMRVGVGRGVALSNLSERVNVPELRSVVTALAQAERLGVPVAQTLQVQATELRVKRRQMAEEQAMKLPVKILFPMVACILPALFIVLLGPAAVRIFEQFK